VEPFETFARRKTRGALEADIGGFATAIDRSAHFGLTAIGNAFSRDRFDGMFFASPARDPRLPAVNLVFVRSREGNTGAGDPSTLGGGDTDKHLVYEGLSRVHVDAVLAGAATARGSDLVFSVWHPALVQLRLSLGRPRHPAQIVVTRSGNLELEGELLFNVAEIPVFLLAPVEAGEALRRRARDRPWLRVISVKDDVAPAAALRDALARLAADHGVHAISAVGGPTIARALLDAGVVQDLYLTTSPHPGGDADTPYHGGTEPASDLVLRKTGVGADAGVVFEHRRVAD
jgi:riboflavin biosynthesis pyrimidine reductase